MYMGTTLSLSNTTMREIKFTQIYELVGGFPANLLSSCISQNIFFHMIGNESFPFHFLKLGRLPILVFTFKVYNYDNSMS